MHKRMMLFLLGWIMLMLVGCGQSGALYLPSQSQQQSTLGVSK